MRESAHRALLRSREKRFDNYIISLAYPKSTLLPSESMQMEIFIYVVEFAFIDTELVVELADGSAKWTCHIHAIGKPPNISQDALFLLDDLDEASKILQPHEVGRDVNFDAIVAQPDRVQPVSIAHTLVAVAPYVQRENLSHLTSVPPPETRHVQDARKSKWHTNRIPIRFSSDKKSHNSTNNKWKTTTENS